MAPADAPHSGEPQPDGPPESAREPGNCNDVAAAVDGAKRQRVRGGSGRGSAARVSALIAAEARAEQEDDETLAGSDETGVGEDGGRGEALVCGNPTVGQPGPACAAARAPRPAPSQTCCWAG